MLLYLRSEVTEGNTDSSRKKSSTFEKLTMKAWKASVGSPSMMRLTNLIGRIAQLPFARNGRLRRLPPPLSGWTRHRSFPAISSSPFRERWKKGINS
jgi:L-lactate dehydrogenase complex protein LldF